MTDAPEADLLFKEFDADNAEPPRRMSGGAVGFDFWAEEIIHEDAHSIWYRTGYGVQIPESFFGDLRARSSVSETGLVLANGCGVVDPDYRGEIQFRFYKQTSDMAVSDFGERTEAGQEYIRSVDIYEPGDRIGQMILVRSYHDQFTGTSVVDEFPDKTGRGESGFGSTGKK
jgi:dUTPase